MPKKLPKLVVILGPTASGKTAVVLKLAKKFNGEIVGADSRQIYRGMDIGTGKVVPDKKSPLRPPFSKGEGGGFVVSGVPHHMIDIVNPDEEFSLAEYKNMAVEIISDILKRGKVPFLVGGTGLYIQAVVDNFVIPRVAPNEKLREKFEKELEEAEAKNQESRITEKWYKKLLKLDPGAGEVVARDNPRRIIRALEVCLATGEPFSKLREKGEQIFDTLQIGLDVPREELYQRIDNRVDEMVKEGLIEETRKLVEKKYDARLPSMSGIGYKEISKYLVDSWKLKKITNSKLQIPPPEADAPWAQNKFQNPKSKIQNMLEDNLKDNIQRMKWRTHDYARRQMTWFKKDKRIRWVKDYGEAEKLIAKWLKK